MKTFLRHFVPFLFCATMIGCSTGSTQGPPPPPPLESVQLQEITGNVPAGMIEIQGLSAGNFNPSNWQRDTLNWVPDVRVPILAPLTIGPWQNIYAPWALEQTTGWRVFYGGWDGTNTPNDRVYSAATSDFLSFNNRTLVIDHGAFIHVNNENVQQLPDGSLYMIGTAAPDQYGLNKPVFFSSPDGVTWNGSPQPYAAQFSDIISIPDYPSFQSGDFNGANVLLYDNNAFTLYFSNWNDQSVQGTMYRATTSQPPVFQVQGLALATGHMVNDVRKFHVGGKNWYVMGLHTNVQAVWYSLSNDGVHFDQEHTMFGPAYAADQYLITLSFVTQGNKLLGVLYGGNIGGASLPQDEIFARWLQKIFTDSSGLQYTPAGSYGPDRQWLQAPSSGSLAGTITVYAEDGATALATGRISISAGKAYQLVFGGG